MLRAEFCRRLDRCQRAICVALSSDNLEGDLLPSLWSLFSCVWCMTYKAPNFVSEPETVDY